MPRCHAHVKQAGERTDVSELMLLRFNIDYHHKEILISVTLLSRCVCYWYLSFIIKIVDDRRYDVTVSKCLRHTTGGVFSYAAVR